MITVSAFMYIYLTSLVFFFGACVGSFLNVCIYRIPRDESVVTPRSHCPNCNTMIAWYDNLPVISYFKLGAKCRHCKKGISPRYVLVEILVAFLFTLVWFRFGIDVRTPIYWLMVGGLVLGTFVDFEHMIIPDRVSIGGIIIGLVLSFFVPSLHGQDTMINGLIYGAIGAAVGFGILWFVGILGKLIFKKDAMGFGDVKLLGAIGAFLGWQAVLFTILLSSLVGATVGIVFIIAKSREMQSRIPYGPYLALGAVVWILWGYHWWDLYITWVSGGLI